MWNQTNHCQSMLLGISSQDIIANGPSYINKENLTNSQLIQTVNHEHYNQTSHLTTYSIPAKVMTHSIHKPSLYKTEMCRNYQVNGQCRYGNHCQFAHGLTDLKPVNHHPRYKTSLCRTYHSTGICSYGPRCNFVHSIKELRTRPIKELPMFSKDSVNNITGINTASIELEEIINCPLNMILSNCCKKAKRIQKYAR